MRPRINKSVVGVRILPSAMTVLAICLGLSAVKFALDGRPTEAMAFMAIAAILDALDGRHRPRAERDRRGWARRSTRWPTR